MSPLPGWGEENGEKPLDLRKLFLEMRRSLVPAPSQRKGWASREFGLCLFQKQLLPSEDTVV